MHVYLVTAQPLEAMPTLIMYVTTALAMLRRQPWWPRQNTCHICYRRPLVSAVPAPRVNMKKVRTMMAAKGAMRCASGVYGLLCSILCVCASSRDTRRMVFELLEGPPGSRRRHSLRSRSGPRAVSAC